MYFVIMGASLISFAPIFVTLADVSPEVAGFYRVFIAGMVLCSVAMFKKMSLWANPRAFFSAVLCGLFFFLDLVCWHRSIQLVGPGLATILTNLQVFILALVGIFYLKERLRWQMLVALPLALLGLFLLIGLQWSQTEANYRSGIYFGFLTAFWYACYTFTLRDLQRYSRSLSPVANLAIISLAAAVFFAITVLANHQSLFHLHRESLGWLVALAILCQVLGWGFIARGLPHVSVSVAGFLLLLQPSLAFVWDMIFFKRPTLWVEIIGALITLSAVYLSTRTSPSRAVSS